MFPATRSRLIWQGMTMTEPPKVQDRANDRRHRWNRIRFWIFVAGVAVAIPTGIIGANVEASNQNLISNASGYGITAVVPPDYVGYVAIVSGLLAFWVGPVMCCSRDVWTGWSTQ